MNNLVDVHYDQHFFYLTSKIIRNKDPFYDYCIYKLVIELEFLTEEMIEKKIEIVYYGDSKKRIDLFRFGIIADLKNYIDSGGLLNNDTDKVYFEPNPKYEIVIKLYKKHNKFISMFKKWNCEKRIHYHQIRDLLGY